MRTVLLVDDQPGVLSALTYVFATAGFATLCANKGSEALVIAENHSFDAALIDLHMPGMDGVTLCRALREKLQGQSHNSLLWIMTAAYTSEAAKLSIESGARSLLKKPFDTGEVIKEIETAIAIPQQLAPSPIAPPVEDQAVA